MGNCDLNKNIYSQLSQNGHLCKVDISCWLVTAEFHLFVCDQTLYKAATSLRLILRVSGLEGVYCTCKYNSVFPCARRTFTCLCGARTINT